MPIASLAKVWRSSQVRILAMLAFTSCLLGCQGEQSANQWSQQAPSSIGAKDAPILAGPVTISVPQYTGEQRSTFQALNEYSASLPRYLHIVNKEHDLVLSGTTQNSLPAGLQSDYGQMVVVLTARDPEKVIYCLEDKLFDNQFICPSGRIPLGLGTGIICKDGYEGTAEADAPRRNIAIFSIKLPPEAYANTAMSSIPSVYLIRVLYRE